jgi:sulfite oxidase
MCKCVRRVDEDWDNLDWSKAPAIQEMPVTSAILSPAAGAKALASEKVVKVEGYALAGGGREIIRVDVSADGGRTWKAANLVPVPEEHKQAYRKHWAWRHWEVRRQVRCVIYRPSCTE